MVVSLNFLVLVANSKNIYFELEGIVLLLIFHTYLSGLLEFSGYPQPCFAASFRPSPLLSPPSKIIERLSKRKGTKLEK